MLQENESTFSCRKERKIWTKLVGGLDNIAVYHHSRIHYKKKTGIPFDNNIDYSYNNIDENMQLFNLSEKHYRTLAATATVQDKEIAREEILSQIKKNTFIHKEVGFPNYDPYLTIAREEKKEKEKLKKYTLYRGNDRG